MGVLSVWVSEEVVPQTKSAGTTPSTLGIGLNSFGTTRRRYRVDGPPDRRGGGEMGPAAPSSFPCDVQSIKLKGKYPGRSSGFYRGNLNGREGMSFCWGVWWAVFYGPLR